MPKIVSFDDIESSRDSSSSASSLVSSPKGIPGSTSLVSSPKGFSGTAEHQLEESYSKSVPSSSVTFGRGSFSENLLLQGGGGGMIGHKKMVRNAGGSVGSEGDMVSIMKATELQSIGSTVKDGGQMIGDLDHEQMGAEHNGETVSDSNLTEQPDNQGQESPSEKQQQQKASVFRKMFSFGSSSISGSNTELQRTSSRTSLDSVQSSKSEHGGQQQQDKQLPKKKGHRKSHSDTSMFSSASIGSRIFRTVVEETKKRFALSEGEVGGSLNSSRASSTKSLNEEDGGYNETSCPVPHETASDLVNSSSDKPGSNVIHNETNLAAALNKGDIVGIHQPVTTSSVQITGVQSLSQSVHPQDQNQASGHRLEQGGEKIAGQRVTSGRTVDKNNGSLLTVTKTASSASLGSYENISIYNG